MAKQTPRQKKVAKLVAGGMKKAKAREVAKPITKAQKKFKGFSRKGVSMRGVGALNRRLAGVGEG